MIAYLLTLDFCWSSSSASDSSSEDVSSSVVLSSVSDSVSSSSLLLPRAKNLEVCETDQWLLYSIEQSTRSNCVCRVIASWIKNRKANPTCSSVPHILHPHNRSKLAQILHNPQEFLHTLYLLVVFSSFATHNLSTSSHLCHLFHLFISIKHVFILLHSFWDQSTYHLSSCLISLVDLRRILSPFTSLHFTSLFSVSVLFPIFFFSFSLLLFFFIA